MTRRYSPLFPAAILVAVFSMSGCGREQVGDDVSRLMSETVQQLREGWAALTGGVAFDSKEAVEGLVTHDSPDERSRLFQNELRVKAEQGDVSAQSELGVSLLRVNYHKEAVLWLESAGNQGDLIAQRTLGFFFQEELGSSITPLLGIGVVDDARVVHWFRLAADQGDARSQIELGLYHLSGRVVPQDYKQAAVLFQLAADQGNDDAMLQLGSLYERVLETPILAIQYYLAAANCGNTEAQNQVGEMYEAGKGIARDYVQAHMWYNLSASQTRRVSLREVRSRFLSNVSVKMTLEQIGEAQRLAREWAVKHPCESPR